jgi:hypothetical protein
VLENSFPVWKKTMARLAVPPTIITGLRHVESLSALESVYVKAGFGQSTESSRRDGDGMKVNEDKACTRDSEKEMVTCKW